ncbi:uncharacterized protein LOC123397185 [Hordeum vulgare subsp. vulgare]|uniref:Uncharacterized protein n=1 Tax=Hordeum vulgare subsp. vulgare TaxID=112509 RepID=A0A8I6XWX5_HORVV|nr:uncharacterized protein LOC123397185 [Hordeum vulgare subsp. vulgare]
MAARAHNKRPLGAVAPEPEQEREPEAVCSPRKRLRRAGLLVMWLDEGKARVVTIGQMARMLRQAQRDVASSIMERLERVLGEHFGAFQSSIMGRIEDKVQSIVQTKMQEQQAASLPSAVHEPPPRHVSEGFPETGSITGVVKLHFDVAGPKDTLFTRCPVWKNGANAKVAILQNEKPITQGDLSKLQIEILPVHADFFTGQEDFTKDEFSKQIYMYKGKESVLTTVSLTNGESSLGSFSFPESSHGKKLRLTARVKRQDLTVRVQEAITDPFVVKDRRSESNEKSSIPSKEDAIHQLKKICLKGKHWNNLVEKNITKVKHLLRHYHKDKFGLQELAGMKNGDWNSMIEHATMSVPGDEIYSYWVPEDNCEILFNDFYDVVGKMTDVYVPYSVSDVDQFPQLKVKNWKMSAYKKFEELENSGRLVPDYFLSNGRLVPAAPPNNGASTSKNQTTAEFGEQQPFLQESGFPLAQIFANNVAGPSNQGPPFAQSSHEQVTHQELYQQDPSTLCNGIPPYFTHGNVDGQGSFSAWSISQSHNFAPAEENNSMTRTYLTAQHNGYSSSLMTAAPGGVSQGTSSLNHDQSGTVNALYTIEELLGVVEEAHVAGQGFIPPNNAELPNSNNQSHGGYW